MCFPTIFLLCHELIGMAHYTATLNMYQQSGQIPISSKAAEQNSILFLKAVDRSIEQTPLVATSNIIPLQISSMIDTDLTKLTADKLIKWALLNL